MDVLTKLYYQKGDVEINTVDFHSTILNTIECFEKSKNFDAQNFELTEYSIEAIKIFKKILYNQKFQLKDAKLAIEVKKLLDYLCIKYKLEIETEDFSDEDVLALFLAGFQVLPEKMNLEQIQLIKNDEFDRFFELFTEEKYPYGTEKNYNFLYLFVANFILNRTERNLELLEDHMFNNNYDYNMSCLVKKIIELSSIQDILRDIYRV